VARFFYSSAVAIERARMKWVVSQACLKAATPLQCTYSTTNVGLRPLAASEGAHAKAHHGEIAAWAAPR
jgi:hypothetical protein